MSSTNHYFFCLFLAVKRGKFYYLFINYRVVHFVSVYNKQTSTLHKQSIDILCS